MDRTDETDPESEEMIRSDGKELGQHIELTTRKEDAKENEMLSVGYHIQPSTEANIIPLDSLKCQDKTMKDQFGTRATLIGHTTPLKSTFPAGIPTSMHCTPVTTLGAFATPMLSPIYLPATFSGFPQQLLTNSQLFVTQPTMVIHPNFQCVPANLTNPFSAISTIEHVPTTHIEQLNGPTVQGDSNEDVVIGGEQSYGNTQSEEGNEMVDSRMKMVPVEVDSDASCEICPDLADNKSVDSVTMTEKDDQFASSESPISENVEEEEEEEDYAEETCSQNPSEVPVSPSGSEEIPSHMDLGDDTEDGMSELYDEPEFVWEEYLRETGAVEVPPTAFRHVECSLQSGFVKNMKLEVAVKNASNNYWVASVIMTCGPLLRLRYDGYGDDGSADFWCDLTSSEVHRIGWCAENGKTLMPPDELKNKIGNWQAFLTKSLFGAMTAPSYLLDKTTGTTPVDQIKQGMRLELQDYINPTQVWIVKVLENVGGRLYLRHEGLDHTSHDFWLFYLNNLFHPIGWAKENGYTYAPRKDFEDQYSKEEWEEILQESLRENEVMPLPIDIFKDQIDIRKHNFKENWKLEAINPLTRNEICPATVIEVIDDKYFIVEIDDLRSERERSNVQFGCHIDSPGIFPAKWCSSKAIRLTPPPGWNRDFSWPEYLHHCKSKAAPRNYFGLLCMDVPYQKFQRGYKLEAVNPENGNQICAATITKIIDRLMWIHLDNSSKMKSSFIEDIESHNLFPVGWSESNGYQLKPPRRTALRRPHRRVAVVQPEPIPIESTYNKIKTVNMEEDTWCPKIYYNHRCFSGPYLAKSRIAELPKFIGPGPIKLVISEVLTMLISVAYKSCRVLRELQMDGEANPNMHQQLLKAKYKGKSYRAVVELCRNIKQLDEFCRQICIKLECCPNLISRHCIDDDCPENCSQHTKTKYTYYSGKKRKKIGRPPGGHSNLENGPKKPGKRRKRRKGSLMNRKTRSSFDDDIYAGSTTPTEEVVPEAPARKSSSSSPPVSESSVSKIEVKKPAEPKAPSKRKLPLPVAPRSEIHTRRGKLPRYSFERKTHKKIMILPPPSSPPPPSKSESPPPVQTAVPVSQTISPVTKEEEEEEPEEEEEEDEEEEEEDEEEEEEEEEEDSSAKNKEEEELYVDIESNPLHWTVTDVVNFIRKTDCAQFGRLFRQEEIDGQALLLLTLPTVQDHLDLKLGPAIKLCHHIERVKIVFYKHYAK